MTTEIVPCQTCQSLVLRYVRHRWHALFQKHVSMLSAFRLSSANDAFHFRPYHKAGHMIVVRRQPRMPELFRYFQPNLASLYKKKIKQALSLTPLNCALNALILALNDSAAALVALLSKKKLIISR